MSSAETDRIEIPIEISTKDKQELEKIKREIEEIEKKTKKIKDESSRQATPTLEGETRGGIFGGKEASKTSGFRDKASAAPIQRENEFKKLKDSLKVTQQAQGQQTAMLNNIFGGKFVGGGAQSKLSSISGIATQASGGGTGLITGFLGRMLPFMVPALIAFGLVDTIAKELFRDGGLFDRRFRRNIQDEIASATERTLKALIRQGIRVIRVTPFRGFRGGGTTVNLVSAREGTPQYGQDFERLGKGI